MPLRAPDGQRLLVEHEIHARQERERAPIDLATDGDGGDAELFEGQQHQPVDIGVTGANRCHAAARQPELTQSSREFSDVPRELRIGNLAAVVDEGNGVRALSAVKFDIGCGHCVAMLVFNSGATKVTRSRGP